MPVTTTQRCHFVVRFLLSYTGTSYLCQRKVESDDWKAMCAMSRLLEGYVEIWSIVSDTESIHHVMWSFLAKIWPKNPQKHHITWRPWAFKTSTVGITWCDNFWPNLRLEVEEGFRIRWRMLAAHRMRYRKHAMCIAGAWVAVITDVLRYVTWRKIKTREQTIQALSSLESQLLQPLLATCPVSHESWGVTSMPCLSIFASIAQQALEHQNRHQWEFPQRRGGFLYRKMANVPFAKGGRGAGGGEGDTTG